MHLLCHLLHHLVEVSGGLGIGVVGGIALVLEEAVSVGVFPALLSYMSV